MYTWHKSDNTKYVYGASSTYTSGMFYDVLHVERIDDGWHGFLLMYTPPSYDEYGEDYDAGGLATVDEELFETQQQAVTWCEQRDTAQYNKENSNEN